MERRERERERRGYSRAAAFDWKRRSREGERRKTVRRGVPQVHRDPSGDAVDQCAHPTAGQTRVTNTIHCCETDFLP